MALSYLLLLFDLNFGTSSNKIFPFTAALPVAKFIYVSYFSATDPVTFLSRVL